MSDSRLKVFLQFVKFGLVGCSNTLLSYIIYAICVKFCMHYLFANVLGFFFGVINAYYWSNRYVFKTAKGRNRNHITALCKTFLSYGVTGVLLQSIMLYLLVENVGFDSLIAQLICLAITVPLNFLLNKFWSFK